MVGTILKIGMRIYIPLYSKRGTYVLFRFSILPCADRGRTVGISIVEYAVLQIKLNEAIRNFSYKL
jgi:hypothetical protein